MNKIIKNHCHTHTQHRVDLATLIRNSSLDGHRSFEKIEMLRNEKRKGMTATEYANARGLATDCF